MDFLITMGDYDAAIYLLSQNWIRNRRRPAAIKSAERLVEKINQGDPAPFTPPTSLTSLISSIHAPTTIPVATLSQAHTLPPGHAQSQAPGTTQVATGGIISQQGLGPSDPKRFCLDQGEQRIPGTLYQLMCAKFKMT